MSKATIQRKGKGKLMASNFKAELRKIISEGVITNGEANTIKDAFHGGELGYWDTESEQHMKTCSVKNMSDFREDFKWVERGHGEFITRQGIHTVITCECGKVDEVTFLVEDATVSTLLIKAIGAE